MLIRCDLHVHSALSPCADDDMTPANIVGYAKLLGLDAVAIADHNAIGNVAVAVEVGKAYGVCVVPAMELQTAEDIHVLCLFPTTERLQSFFDEIEFSKLVNDPSVFGRQLIVDEDDNVVATEPRLLHVGANIAVEKVPDLARKHGGVAVAAHVDRDENGMVAILGGVWRSGVVESCYGGTSQSLFRQSRRHKQRRTLVGSYRPRYRHIGSDGKLGGSHCKSIDLLTYYHAGIIT